MEHLLLPAVAELALMHVRTPVFVVLEEHFLLPVGTRLERIKMEVGAASKVLVIVGVETLGFVMVEVEWAPLSFEIGHEEVPVRIIWN